ncbi:M4 family metallopeptidase [Arsenicicoccus dermatophilus]|uniref:M4 family metallopeptidase n=1 Tax=Arsenicicoccus dermatophilus TaxID=1076331 RepID=UPI0039170522
MSRVVARSTLALACAVGVAGIGVGTPASAVEGPGAPATPHAAAALTPAEHAFLMAGHQLLVPDLRSVLKMSILDTFQVRSAVKDQDGTTHSRVDRYYRGHLVVGGDIVITRDRWGKLLGYHAVFTGPVTVDLTPKLSSAQARGKALAVAKARQGFLNGLALTFDQVVVYVDRAGSQRLAYQTKAVGLDPQGTPARVNVLIDATTGATLRAYDEIRGARHGAARAGGANSVTPPRSPASISSPLLSVWGEASGIGKGVRTGTSTLTTTRRIDGSYELRNPRTGNWTTDSRGTTSTGEVVTSPGNVWGDGTPASAASAAVDAQIGADRTFAYFKDVLARNGIWDSGKGVRSRVHYDQSYDNAFWDGEQMSYGDGAGNARPLTEIDVAGHEMTHGVTEQSAGLVYEGEAGGLDEATSDIFGTAVERHAALPSDPPDYVIGEVIDLNGDGTPLRYLDKPSRDGVSPDCWSPTLGTLDPHLSSGPLNHWYYLVSEGSGAKRIGANRYDSPTCGAGRVTGAGPEVAERVWYRTLTTKLTSTATYAEAREGAIRSAVELYGTNSPQCRSVAQAFDAIAVKPGKATCAEWVRP